MIRHTRALDIRQAAMTRDLQAMFQQMANELRGVLLRYANANGNIDPTRGRAMRTEASARSLSYFVGVDGRNAYGNNNIALAAYPRLLNRHVARITGDVVLAHTKWLQANVPSDILRWMASGIDPIQEQFRSNPLARYEHSHEWLDSRGYTLSDRIWQTGERTRRNIDVLLAKGIENGNSAVSIANLLERYLLPKRAPIRTRTPYGRDGSFDARRLARSEITLAHSRASLVSAGMNPFVDSMNWNLSTAHPRYDICDPIAAGSPYPVDECPTPVLSSHPHCLCNLSPNIGDMNAIVEQLREDMNNGVIAMLNPSNPRNFLKDLLEEVLFTVLLAELRGDDIDAYRLLTEVGIGLIINRVEI